MSIAIKVENLSKAYQLGEIGTGTPSRDLERWLAKVRGKEDPFIYRFYTAGGITADLSEGSRINERRAEQKCGPRCLPCVEEAYFCS